MVKSTMKLHYYILRRLLLMGPVVFGVIVITFLTSHLIPADPAQMMAGPQAPEEVLIALRISMGLDKPLYQQFMIYLFQLLHGDLGISITTHRPVLDDLMTFFPATLELTLAAMTLAIAVGIPLGIATATRHNRLPDHVIRVFSLIGVATPVFWSGLLGLLVFYYALGLVPGPGRIDVGIAPPPRITGLFTLDSILQLNWPAFLSSLDHLILPTVVLAFHGFGMIVRMVRSGMLEVLREDYIVMARAKGLPESVVVYKHAFKNAMTTTLTLIGLMFGSSLAGTVLIETIFSWPGIGSYAVTAITHVDFAAVMGYTILVSLIYIFVNLGVDLLYGIVDPRIRLD
jgi:peptide/nickel transport system permease protein